LYGALHRLKRKGLVHVTPSIPETFTAVSPLTVLNPKAREIADQAASALEVVQKLAEEYALKANGSGGLELPTEANELWHIDGWRIPRIHRLCENSPSYLIGRGIGINS
jgi:sugar-specific transcriptional regulator TrmB